MARGGDQETAGRRELVPGPVRITTDLAVAQQRLAGVRGQRAHCGDASRGLHPDEGLPSGALPEHGAGRGSALTLRDFEPEHGNGVARADPPTAEHPLLLLLSTDGDRPEDWARAGAALARVLLTATAAGLVANPQTQVLEVPGLRSSLTAELGLVGYPQMLLRVGYPTGPGSPPAGRRPLADVMSR